MWWFEGPGQSDVWGGGPRDEHRILFLGSWVLGLGI